MRLDSDTPTVPRLLSRFRVGCVRRRRWAPTVSVALAACTATALAACGATESNTSQTSQTTHLVRISTPGSSPQRGGTLTIDAAESVTGLDPLGPLTSGAVQVSELYMDQLVEYAPHHVNPLPALAASWTITNGGRTYTFHLRPGVKFSDGQPLTAADVVFSLKRYSSPQQTIVPTCCLDWKNVTAPNARTVQLTLSRPDPLAIPYLATAEAAIYPQQYFNRVGAKGFGQHPIGTGPFELKTFTPGGTIEMVRNPHYWRPGQPYVDGITIHSVSDSNSRILAVTSGQADVADGVPYSSAAALAARNDTYLLHAYQLNVIAMWMNAQSGPLAETAVRRALSYATDRAAIVKDVYHGYAKIANSPGPDAGDWDPSVRQLPFSLSMAKQELAHSSYPHGFPLTIQVTSGDPNSALIASILQSSFDQIGVSTSIQRLDPSNFQTAFGAGKFEMEVQTNFISDIPQTDELAELFATPDGTNAYFTWYKNPATAALLTRIQNTPSEPAHSQLVAQLQQALVNDPPILALTYPDTLAVTRTDVCGLAIAPASYWGVFGLDNLVYKASKC